MQSRRSTTCRRYLGAVVPAYNVPGVSGEVKFSGPVLADIFMGKITNWNDKAIAKLNPGVSFPDRAIVIVHRSDGSGTSYIFTDFLSKVSPEWASGPGKGTSVKWPVGLGAKGNEGVAGMIRQMQGALGYVELIYALQNNIAFGSVQNASGNFVKASLASTTAAAASMKTMPARFPGLDYECTREGCVSDCELHLVAGTSPMEGRRQVQDVYGLPDVDAGQRAGHGGAVELRSAAEGSCGERARGNQADTVVHGNLNGGRDGCRAAVSLQPRRLFIIL